MIPFAKPVFNKEMEEAAIHALNNEKFVLGESVFRFEEEFAEYVGADFAVSTSSGTNALQISMFALELSGSEIITCPASFVATANSIIHAGAKPVFADCEASSPNINPEKIPEKINSSTKAVMPIHLYGIPAEMDEINEIAKEKSLYVIEDACQSHGAVYKGRKTGALGTIGCFSFYSTKNLTVCGDGGMITTNDEKTAETARKIRDCGRKSRYEHDVLGYTSRLNTVNAAIGRVQLRYLDRWNERRREIAGKYSENFRDITGLRLPEIKSHSRSVFHLFPCMTEKRNELAEHLKKEEIQTGFNFPIPIHLQPLYRERFGCSEGDCPNAERLSKEVICLPIYPELKEEEVNTVIDAVKGFFR